VRAVRQERANSVCLSEDTVDEIRLVTSPDEEMLGARAEQAAASLDSDPAAVALGVDDGDARRADGDVVDVAPASRHSAVVQEDHASFARPPLELVGKLDLCFCSARPGALVPRLAAHRQHYAAEHSEPLADARLAIRPSTLVLAPCARACLRRRRRRRLDLAVEAARVPALRVPDRGFPGA
jgi:hypothetical protein